MPGKSGFDERDPLSLGSGCGTTTQMAHEWLKYSDVILALGSSLKRSPYAQAIPKGKILIQILIILTILIRMSLYRLIWLATQNLRLKILLW